MKPIYKAREFIDMRLRIFFNDSGMLDLLSG